MGWLSKPAGDSKPQKQSEHGSSGNSARNASKAEKPSLPMSPSKSSDIGASDLFTSMSSKSIGARVTSVTEPSTSDPIDVDMLSLEEDEGMEHSQTTKVSPGFCKFVLRC